jgi:hypothetical protein
MQQQNRRGYTATVTPESRDRTTTVSDGIPTAKMLTFDSTILFSSQLFLAPFLSIVRLNTHLYSIFLDFIIVDETQSGGIPTAKLLTFDSEFLA